MRSRFLPLVLSHLHSMICLLTWGGFAICSSLAQQPGSEVPPTIDNPNQYAVTNPATTRRIFQLASTRRIDFAIIGDSNTRQLQTTGHEDGMGRAFAARFGMYATRVDPVAGRGLWGAGILSDYSNAGDPFTEADSPESASPYFYNVAQFPNGIAYLPPGSSLPTSYNLGLGVLADNPVSIAANLRYHVTDRPLSGGEYWFSVRALFPASALSDIVSAHPSFPAGDRPLRDFWIDVPAGERPPTGLLFCPADLQEGHATSGPIAMLYHRVENRDRPTGIAYSPMWAEGGQDARKALEDMLSTPRNASAMAEWMRQATRLQGEQAALVVHILHGGNDAGDIQPSLGPVAGLQSNTYEGHKDNIQGIINFVRGVWTNAGFDSANLFFILGPYHPRDDRLDFQHDFEHAWRTIAQRDPQVVAVAGTMISTADEFLARGFNRSDVDAAHLSFEGYRMWGDTTVRVLSRAACPADFDENGSLAVADIFAFLNSWFASSAASDVDYSGALEVNDVFAYLAAWFAGCQ